MSAPQFRLSLKTKPMRFEGQDWVKCAAILAHDDKPRKLLAVWNSADEASASKEFAAYETAYAQSNGHQGRAADAILALRMTA